MHRLLVTANVPNSPILVTLIMEELRPSEMSVLARTTERNIPEDGIPHSSTVLMVVTVTIGWKPLL
jgi:hypothetical protein